MTDEFDGFIGKLIMYSAFTIITLGAFPFMWLYDEIPNWWYTYKRYKSLKNNPNGQEIFNIQNRIINNLGQVSKEDFNRLHLLMNLKGNDE